MFFLIFVFLMILHHCCLHYHSFENFHPLIFSVLNSQTHNTLNHVFSPSQDCTKSIEFGAKKREPGWACNEKKFPYLTIFLVKCLMRIFTSLFLSYISSFGISLLKIMLMLRKQIAKIANIRHSYGQSLKYKWSIEEKKTSSPHTWSGWLIQSIVWNSVD